MSQSYTKKSDGWYVGCGCGQKKGDLITPPENSVEGLMLREGQMSGPISQIIYSFRPNMIAIDIHPADAKIWKEEGILKQNIAGFKGYSSRLATPEGIE